MTAPTWPDDPDNPYVDGVEHDIEDEIEAELTDKEAEEAILAA